MLLQSFKPTWRRSLASAMLATLSARPAAALLTNPLIHLFQGAPIITPDMPIATLTAQEANFTGYASQALPALVGPVNLAVYSDGLIFDVTWIVGANPIATNNITGYWIDQNAGADWVIAEMFTQSVPMAIAGDFLNLLGALAFDLRAPAQ
jgi:hypothetical protein